MRIRFIGRGVPVMALLCGIHGGAVHAQDQAAGDAAAHGAIPLEGVSIFATLSPIASFDYPGQVGVVEREELETRQASTLADIFAGVPGVLVDGGARRSGQVPTIRGIREEDILVLIDGARQSFISGHDGRLFVEPDLLKRAEVVKGPVSSLYGSGALGGVIALTTVDALDFLEAGETQGVRVKAGLESVDKEMLFSTTAFARSLDGRFDVVGSLAYRDSGNIALGSGFTLPDDHEIVSGLLKGSVQLAPGLSFQTSWIHYGDDAITPNNPQNNSV
jgi:hemoglobin/transferrin/lactoferrin receptor protein